MLIYKDSNAEKCMYECDRCKRQMTTLEKMSIFTAGFAENPRITWHLCPHCFKLLQKGIKHYPIART